MKVLLDTRVLLWFFEGSRLSQTVKSFLQDTANNETFVSHAASWEF